MRTLVAGLLVIALGSVPGYAEPRQSPTATAAAAAQARAKPAPRTPRAVSTRTLAAPTAPSAMAIYLDYQRVGRALILLRDQRGAADCAELWQRFRMIRLDDAVATRDSRLEALAELDELRARAERLKGIEISSACLRNPLAAGCR